MYCIVCNSKLKGVQKKFCSNVCKQRQHYSKCKNNSNSYHSQTIRSIKRKLHFIELSGGCCSLCGYNKNISALEFHHINPKLKSFNLDSRNLSNNNMKTLTDEFMKCKLLCSNCHKEEHYPENDYIQITKKVESWNQTLE